LTVRLASIVVGSATLLLLCVPAWAQDDRRPSRPYRGLFGPDGRDAAQVLSANGAIGIGYDTDVVAQHRDLALASLSLERTADPYSLFGGGLSYMDHGERYDFGASIQSIARNYARFSTVSSHAATVSGALRVLRRTTLVAAQTFSYEPFGTLFRFPTLAAPGIGQIQPTAPEFSVVGGSYTTYSSSATATQQLSKRSSVTANYLYSGADLTASSSGGYRTQQGLLRFSHNMTRNTGWHAGYGYTVAHYPGAEDAMYRGDTIDVGIDYSRDLSVTRRTRLSFSTGATGIKERGHTRYLVTGTAVLNREFGRTWRGAAVYTRSVGFFETIPLPYFYDGVSIGMFGLVSSRLESHTSVGATFGDLSSPTVRPGSNRFTTGYGNTGILFAISRFVGVAADYLIYTYSVDDTSVITHGLLRPELTRQSVTVSLRAWVPIVERGRRPNATR